MKSINFMGQNTLAMHSFIFENLPRIMESAGIRFGNVIPV